MLRAEYIRNKYVEEGVAEVRYLDPKSKLNALNHRGKADFSGLVRDHDAASAASP